MNFFRWLKNCFLRLFKLEPNQPAEPEDLTQDYDSLELEAEEFEENVEKFKIKNVVFEKLNYLEQYIKSFSLSFPAEYNMYLDLIVKQRIEYQEELNNYNSAFSGNIAFAVNPEQESRRIAQIAELEKQITHFVDFVVLYSMYKDKFSTLCSKLNRFYNTLVNCHVAREKVIKQFDNATIATEKLTSEVQKLYFFEQDSRKKEEILNYLVYCDYLLFKILVRYSLCSSLYEYKHNTSKFYSLFVDTEYDKLIFKFFIQDLEQIQAFITTNLQDYESCNYLLDSCENLQVKIQSYADVTDTTYFEEIVKLENTLEEVAKTVSMDFIICMPQLFGTVVNISTSANDVALSVLKLIGSGKAKLLLEIIKSFKIDISWEELYFLCKVFDVYEQVIEVSKSTVFTSVEINFLGLEKKYPQYSSTYIVEQKRQLLKYHGARKKKYILLFSEGTIDNNFAVQELERLSLDFVVIEGAIYLNHSYFNGFKNLEHIFGNYITL